MARSVAATQRAAQITFILSGHPGNAQISYVRATALLAKARDSKLYRRLEALEVKPRRIGLAAIGGTSLPG
jgi:hypothetical protein